MPSLAAMRTCFAAAIFLSLLFPSPEEARAAQGDCSQPVTSGTGPSASDCLFILKAAVGSESCVPECVCAPQDGLPVASSDALRCLRKAVGQPVALECGCAQDHAIIRVHYYVAPADGIALRGSGGGLSPSTGVSCVPNGSEVWTCDLGVVSGSVQFKPWIHDSIEAAGTDYRFDAPGEIDVFPFFVSTAGRVEIIEDVASAALGNSRDVAVYLPPSYDENVDKDYPVLFMQDGQNLFDEATAFGGVEWELDEALDELAREGAITETIVVAPYSSASRLDEYTPTVDEEIGQGGGGNDYLDFLLDELMPQIVSSYRVEPGSKPGIAGSSLGGLIAIYGAWTRHADFARVGSLSPSLYWDDQYVIGLIESDDDPKVPLRIYLDVGTGETNASLVNDLTNVLLGKGWVLGTDLLYVSAPGHLPNESYWAERAPGAMAFLLRDPDRVEP